MGRGAARTCEARRLKSVSLSAPKELWAGQWLVFLRVMLGMFVPLRFDPKGTLEMADEIRCFDTPASAGGVRRGGPLDFRPWGTRRTLMI